jgi:hypothetical protein
MTEKEKQANMKNMGSKAFDRGQHAKFSTLHILDFGQSLTNLQIEEFDQLTEEQKEIFTAKVVSVLSGLSGDDLVCFKSDNG